MMIDVPASTFRRLFISHTAERIPPQHMHNSTGPDARTVGKFFSSHSEFFRSAFASQRSSALWLSLVFPPSVSPFTRVGNFFLTRRNISCLTRRKEDDDGGGRAGEMRKNSKRKIMISHKIQLWILPRTHCTDVVSRCCLFSHFDEGCFFRLIVLLDTLSALRRLIDGRSDLSV